MGVLRAASVLGLVGQSCAFTFLSIGDWGDPAAKQLNPLMGKETPEFVLAIGDNFYSKGVTGVTDPQWDTKFEKTFTAPSLNVSWYVTSGNHDYYGGKAGINAEIAYTKHSNRWQFPDYYHSKDLTAKDGTTLQIVAVDTWRLNGGDTFVKFDPKTERMALHSKALLDEKLASGAMNQATYDTLLTNFDEEDPENPIPWCGGGRAKDGPPCEGDQEQLDWIEKTLMGSDADWKIVMGHFPIYSCTRGEHGETPKLIADLDPILHKAKADMYFNGHDHILQHTMREGVHYFGSGAGAQKHVGVNSNYTGLLGVHAGHYGFMLHEGNKTSMTTTFVIDDGSKPYTYTINKGGASGAVSQSGAATRGGQAPAERLASRNDGSSPPGVGAAALRGDRATIPTAKGLRSKQH